jgi:hypothetical protein
MKLLRYITIILFALASVLIGCTQNPTLVVKQKVVAAPKVTNPNYNDTIMINLRIMLYNQRILGEVNRCRRKRDECEIKYLRTGDEKYVRLGNKYVDSLNYYAKQIK